MIETTLRKEQKMSIITLAMAKPSYVYEEIIGKNVLISIPEGRGYTSLEVRNGFGDQTFSSNDLPSSIITKCLGVTRCGDGKVHPVCYSQINLIEEFSIRGLTGFENGVEELNKICQVFTQQEGLYFTRSCNMQDRDILYKPNSLSSYWLASRKSQKFVINTSFRMCVKSGEGVSYQALYDTDVLREYAGTYSIRAVFILSAEALFPERKINWIDS